jgi:hypothetical protein
MLQTLVIVGAVFLYWFSATLNRGHSAASAASGFRFKWNPVWCRFSRNSGSVFVAPRFGPGTPSAGQPIPV